VFFPRFKISILITDFFEKEIIIEKGESNHEAKDEIKNIEGIKTKSIEQKIGILSTKSNNWFVIASSSIGKYHLEASPPIPCQDSHYIRKLENGWGVAIVCDGAGSKKNSHIGSKYIAEKAGELFIEYFDFKKWNHLQKLPEEQVWKKFCKKLLSKLLNDDLQKFARENSYDLDSLGCTIIVVIYSKFGLLTTHIGDGRAGFCTSNGIWQSVIDPHKGEEANQTIFLTSAQWCFEEDFQINGISVPESRVINEKPIAFTLISDGCEKHCFETGFFDKDREVFVEENKPYPNFFNPIINTFKQMIDGKIKEEEIQLRWDKFLKEGTKGLLNEADDKTMILGFIH
jgi:hypothetical protein